MDVTNCLLDDYNNPNSYENYLIDRIDKPFFPSSRTKKSPKWYSGFRCWETSSSSTDTDDIDSLWDNYNTKHYVELTNLVGKPRSRPKKSTKWYSWMKCWKTSSSAYEKKNTKSKKPGEHSTWKPHWCCCKADDIDGLLEDFKFKHSDEMTSLMDKPEEQRSRIKTSPKWYSWMTRSSFSGKKNKTSKKPEEH